jgi:hypothetical protein
MLSCSSWLRRRGQPKKTHVLPSWRGSAAGFSALRLMARLLPFGAGKVQPSF